MEVYVLMLGASLHPASASLKAPIYYFFSDILPNSKISVEVALSESFLLLKVFSALSSPLITTTLLKTFELQTNFVFKFNSKRC